MNNLTRIVLVILTSTVLFSGFAQAESPAADAMQLAAQAQDESVNVNVADAETLARVLKGVGKQRAQAIIDYRENNGAFGSVEDLMQVKGLGVKFLEKNKGKLRF